MLKVRVPVKQPDTCVSALSSNTIVLLNTTPDRTMLRLTASQYLMLHCCYGATNLLSVAPNPLQPQGDSWWKLMLIHPSVNTTMISGLPHHMEAARMWSGQAVWMHGFQGPPSPVTSVFIGDWGCIWVRKQRVYFEWNAFIYYHLHNVTTETGVSILENYQPLTLFMCP